MPSNVTWNMVVSPRVIESRSSAAVTVAPAADSTAPRTAQVSRLQSRRTLRFRFAPEKTFGMAVIANVRLRCGPKQACSSFTGGRYMDSRAGDLFEESVAHA